MQSLKGEVNNYEESEKDRDRLDKKRDAREVALVASEKKTREVPEDRTVRFTSLRKNVGGGQIRTRFGTSLEEWRVLLSGPL